VATREALFVCLLLVLATAACHGPSLCVATDGDCYVDGCAESRTELPFRYYGTRTIDVLPNRTLAPTDFARQPARQAVPVEPPVSQWLFPLDFLGEVVIRTFWSTPQQSVTVTSAQADNDVIEGFPPSGIDDLRNRAAKAKISR
jgi:hypothetical protein